MTNTKSTKSATQTTSTIPTFREVTIGGETYWVLSDIIPVTETRSPRKERVIVDAKSES